MSGQTQSQEAPLQVESPAAKDPAVRLFIIAAMLIGFGVWCFVDGYVRKTIKKEDITGINKAATYYLNHVGGIALPLAGLIPLAWGLVVLRRRLVADEEGIGYVGKERIPWTAVRSMDTAKLADKGILRLEYDSGSGQRSLVLDSWKLQNFRELVALVEKKVGPKDSQ
jgi:hypothetical protein